MTKKKQKRYDTTRKSLRAPEFIRRFSETANDIAPARYFVRAKEHQEASIERLSELQDYAADVKTGLSNDQPRDANLILSIECMIGALIEELEMIVAMKERRPNDAWDHLLASRNSAEAAARAHPVSDKLNVNSFLTRIDAYERLVFPSMQFVSPAFNVGSMICSICDEEYATCSHVKGRAYAGEFCSVELRDLQEMDHLALVDEPFSKAQRITQTVSGEDIMALLPPDECNPEDSVVSVDESEGMREIDDEERPEIDSGLESLRD